MTGLSSTFCHTKGRMFPLVDAEIYVEQIGHGGLPVLLMLHGGFGSIEDFNGITVSLASRFSLIGIDTRGHGRSSLGTTQLTYELLADDLAHVIDALQLQRFSLLGFSDGGIAAYRYAARRDPRLQGVVTVGASWEMDTNQPAWQMVSGMTGKIWEGMFPASVETYKGLSPVPDFDRLANAVIAMWTDLSSSGYPGDLVSQVICKMLVVRGEDDPLTTSDELMKLQGLVKDTSVMEIPSAGHAAFDDSPEVFLSAMEQFLDV